MPFAITTHLGFLTCLVVCCYGIWRQHSNVPPMRAEYLDWSGPMRAEYLDWSGPMRVLHSAEVAGRAGPGESQSGQLGEQSYVHHLSQSVSGHCQSVGSAGCRREIILTSNTQLVFSLTMNLSVTIITIILAVSVSPSPIPGRFSVLTDLCSRMSRICSLFLRSDFTQI